MFYGRITSNATVYGATNSNNWSVERGPGGSNGFYKITLGQYLRNAPSVTAAPCFSTSSAPTGPTAARTATVVTYQNDDGAWEIYITIKQGDNPSNIGCCFTVHSGCRRVFEVTDNADTLTLDPEIVSFNGTKLLVLKTSSLGLGSPLYLDKGSVLIGVGTTMKLELGSTTVSDGDGNTWNLTGWTYGGGFGSNNDGTGAQWAASPVSGSANYLTVDPGGTNGPVTTPYTFAIKGVLQRAAEGVPTYISSDPVVRLSAVSPGGLTL